MSNIKRDSASLSQGNAKENQRKCHFTLVRLAKREGAETVDEDVQHRQLCYTAGRGEWVPPLWRTM